MIDPTTRAAQVHEVAAVIEQAKIGRPKPTKATRAKLVKSVILPPKKSKTKTARRKAAKPDPDYWFSLCVRERANWTCESCGKKYEPWTGTNGEPANPGLHCSHYIGRANYAVRFDPINVNAHCYGCHAKFEGDPHTFQEWKRTVIGNELYDILIEKSKNVMLGKQGRKDKQVIADHFKSEFRKMQSARSLSGWDGYLNFAGYL